MRENRRQRGGGIGCQPHPAPIISNGTMKDETISWWWTPTEGYGYSVRHSDGIEEIKPRFWIMENPRGALRHFIGKPATTIRYADYGYVCAKPTDLWGVFPWFYSHTAPNDKPTPWDIAFPHHSRQWKKERARVPYALSEAVCLALEREIEPR